MTTSPFPDSSVTCYPDRYVKFDGGCDDGPYCETDMDCTNYAGYCDTDINKCIITPCSSNAQCGEGYCLEGHCRIQPCTVQDDCAGHFSGAGERCMNGYCVIDLDDDGLCHEDMPGRYCNYMFDCNDDSNICTDTCVNSDEGTATATAFRDTDTYDCNDICIDDDEDGFCREDSVRLKRTYHAEGGAVIDLAGLDADEQEVFDQMGFTADEQLMDLKYKADFSDKLVWIIGNIMLTPGWEELDDFSDCDDADDGVFPGLFEGGYDFCDLKDNDCDGLADECGAWTAEIGQDPVFINELEGHHCVYSGTVQGCYDWDLDGDGFKNEDFGCPDCTDCSDCTDCLNGGAAINPSVTEIDNDLDDNCNGVVDEIDENGDGVPETFDIEGPPDTFTEFTLDDCPDQDDSTGPTAPNGCLFSISKETLHREWSTGSV
ncbi:MopE-related protein [Nanoarchaeota archaeon]